MGEKGSKHDNLGHARFRPGTCGSNARAFTRTQGEPDALARHSLRMSRQLTSSSRSSNEKRFANFFRLNIMLGSHSTRDRGG